jgi:membrane protein implicated in regulation of membrane protease activity
VDADLLWLIAGIGLLLAEIFTLTVVLGMVGVGALAAAALAFAGGGAVVQLVGFGVTSTALLVFARPPVQKALNRGPWATTDARALQGSSAVVVERVSDDSGQVRLNGELWRARPYAGTGPVEVGQRVSVAAVEGATVLVYSPDLT